MINLVLKKWKHLISIIHHRSSVIGQLTFVWSLCLVLGLSQAFAQSDKYKITKNDYNNQEVEMADAMRQNGKIYVVVSVIFIIFAGIVFFLYRLDKKVSTLEKEVAEERKED